MLNVKNGDAGWRLQASSSSPSSQCVQKELFSHHLFFVGDGGIKPPQAPLSLNSVEITKKMLCRKVLANKESHGWNPRLN